MQTPLPDRTRFDQILNDHPGCGFIADFCEDHPNAGLFLVGGAVRDIFLQRPCKDVDFVVTHLRPKVLESWLGRRGDVEFVGKRFGVYKFLPTGLTAAPDAFVDIAFPRTESPTKDSAGGYRDFEVVYDPELPIQDDLARRDFTINAMAFDVRTGTLTDPHGGIADLTAKHIRAVGDAEVRFAEDLSRVLRAVRFATQLSFSIETRTWDALRAMAPEINRERTLHEKREYVVPRETLGREVRKALQANAARALDLFETSGLLPVILPEVQTATIATDRLTSLPYQALLAILFQRTPVPVARETLRHLGEDVDEVLWIADKLNAPPDPSTIRPSVFERTYLTSHGRALLEALAATNQSALVEAAATRERALHGGPLLVTGRDVLANGISEGPKVRVVLDLVRDAQLEGKITTRDEALDLLKGIV